VWVIWLSHPWGPPHQTIGELTGKLNQRPFRKLTGTREAMYRSIDLPMLRPLPAQPYVFAEWKRARVNIDYHVDLERHYYSVPYQLVGKEVDVRYTGTTVEILYQGRRVASHARSNRLGKHSTLSEHRPKAHQKYLEWTPSRIVEWAGTIGPFTAQLAERIMAERPHPEQGYRSCMGLIGLGRRYGKDRLEAAAQRAIHLQAHSYASVKSILARGLDRQSAVESVTLPPPVEHANIRGAGYYAGSLFEEAVE